ncbi:MAG: hypothetical protein GF330_06185 [Candidatus Eisenbacteria bacterium]|nr:hypothetical protein [Candidatus Eisenbacteria bacterium]
MARLAARFPKRFDFDELVSVDFVSPRPRPPLLPTHTSEMIRANNNFELLYYFPATLMDQPTSDLVIMINGFDEQPPGLFLYYSKRQSISKLLEHVRPPYAKRRQLCGRVASVLLPIPFHHWRRPLQGDYTLLDSAHMIDRHKIRFFLGYHQLLCDLDELVSTLDRRSEPVYARRMGSTLNLHLLGYSLGGLAALCGFLRDRMLGRNRFTSCTLLASGISLQEASFALTDLSAAQISDIKEYYSRNEWKTDFLSIMPESEREEIIETLFERAVLGRRDGQAYAAIDTQWIESADEIQYITCTKDRIMDSAYLYREIPEGAFRIHHTAVEVDHVLHADRNWMSGEGEKVIGAACDVMLRRSRARGRG